MNILHNIKKPNRLIIMYIRSEVLVKTFCLCWQRQKRIQLQ